MTAAVLSIGTEITRGEITNTNSSWLCEELTRAGLEVSTADTVPDDRDAIRDVLRRLGDRHSLVVCTGGLGPTTDDITSECVADVLGVPLDRDADSLEAIFQRLARSGRTLTESNAKQADFPRGARVLPNPHGTAPGFAVRIGRAECFFMPGVPGEMKPMFTAFVEPRARAAVSTGIHQVRLRTFGLAESTVNDRLAGIETEYRVAIAYRAHFPEIEVKVLARAANKEQAEQVARRAADEVKSRLGDVVFAEGDTGLAAVVSDLLRQRGLTFGTGESCTGGLVADLVTEEPGASDVFRGAVVAYDNAVKESLLGVEPALLGAHGAVSAEVARAMAEGARRALGVDVSLALTGIAGPGGGTDTKPVGLVHYAVATPDVTESRKAVYPGTRHQVRLRAAYAGLSLVRQLLSRGSSP